MKLKRIDTILILTLFGSAVFFLYNKYKKTKSHNLNIAKTEIRWLGGKEINLGVIALEKPVTFLNKFVNIGSNVLWIENQKSSCGCTGFSFSTTELKPNDTCIIQGTISPKFKGVNNVAITFDANTEDVKNKIVVHYEGKE
jgi:hypothetical protein